MQGPLEQEHILSRVAVGFRHLIPGRRYSVLQDFVDCDGDLHPVGERWTFLGCNELESGDGVSLFVSPCSGWMFILRLVNDSRHRNHALRDLAYFIGPVGDEPQDSSDPCGDHDGTMGG